MANSSIGPQRRENGLATMASARARSRYATPRMDDKPTPRNAMLRTEYRLIATIPTYGTAWRHDGRIHNTSNNEPAIPINGAALENCVRSWKFGDCHST